MVDICDASDASASGWEGRQKIGEKDRQVADRQIDE